MNVQNIFGVDRKTIYFLANRCYKKRLEERKKSKNPMIAIPLERD